MAKTMRMNGFTITERADGTYKVTRSAGEFRRVTEIHKSFYDAGEAVYEMAPNNDIGAKINHRMCDVFGKTFA